MVGSVGRCRWQYRRYGIGGGGVPPGLRRGVEERGDGLEVGELADDGHAGEVGDHQEVEAELRDDGERCEVRVAVSAVRNCWGGGRAAGLRGPGGGICSRESSGGGTAPPRCIVA